MVQPMLDGSNIPSMLTDGIPQIYFDQMNHIHTHLKDLTHAEQQNTCTKSKNNGQQALCMEQVHHIHGILEEMRTTTKEDLQARVNKENNKLCRRELIKSGN